MHTLVDIMLTIAIASESDAIMSCMESIANNEMLISEYTTIIIGIPIIIALGRFLINAYIHTL